MPKLIDLNDQWFAIGVPLNVHSGIYNAPYDVTFDSWVVPMGTVGIANERSLKLLAPELLNGSALGVFSGDLELSDKSFNALVEALNGLCNYPLIDGDMLTRVEDEARRDWWNEYGGQRAVNIAMWNGAYKVWPDLEGDDARVRTFGTFAEFVAWAREWGEDVHERESWSTSGYYELDIDEWVEARAYEMYARTERAGVNPYMYPTN